MKRITFLLPLFFLAACGRTVKTSPNDVVLWHWMTDREEALQNLANQYRQETGIHVRLELYAPSDAYASKVRAAAQTHTLPDIFGVLGESRDLASYIKSGHVANLEPAMDAVKKSWRNRFFAKALATSTYLPGNQYGVQPGIYGVPIDVTNIQMLYNKDLLGKVNVTQPPQSWKEWVDVGRKLKAAGIEGMVAGWGETWLIDCFANNYAMNIMGEEKVLNTYRGKVPYTDPDWVRVFRLFDELRKEGLLVSGVVTMVNKTAEQTFANGKAAFAFNGSWCVNVYKGMNPNLSFGAMPPPRVNTLKPMRIWGGAGSSFMVNAASDKKDKAIDFLRWLTGPTQQAALSTDTLNLPSNRNSLGQLPEILAQFVSRMDETTHPSQWPVTENPLVSEAFCKGIQSILIGEKTPLQTAQDVQRVKERETH